MTEHQTFVGQLLAAISALAATVAALAWRQFRRLDTLQSERDEQLRKMEAEHDKLKIENARLRSNEVDD